MLCAVTERNEAERQSIAWYASAKPSQSDKSAVVPYSDAAKVGMLMERFVSINCIVTCFIAVVVRLLPYAAFPQIS